MDSFISKSSNRICCLMNSTMADIVLWAETCQTGKFDERLTQQIYIFHNTPIS